MTTAWIRRMETMLARARSWRAVRRMLRSYPFHTEITDWLRRRLVVDEDDLEVTLALQYRPEDLVDAIADLTRDDYLHWKAANRDAFHVVFQNRIVPSRKWGYLARQGVPDENRFVQAVAMAIQDGNCWPILSFRTNDFPANIYEGLMALSDYTRHIRQGVQAGTSMIRNRAWRFARVAPELPRLQRDFERVLLPDGEVANVLELPPGEPVNEAQCYYPDCGARFRGETPAEVDRFKAEHYMRDHTDVMPGRPPE